MKEKILAFFILSIPIMIIASKRVSNLPVSNDASIIEYTSPTEVIIKATGIGIDYKHRKPRAKDLDKNANIDARRAAIWYLLYSGSDPILNTEESRKKFEAIHEEFFRSDNIDQFIVWESSNYEQRIKIDNGKRLKITKTFKVNIRLLKDYLTKKDIIQSEREIVEKVGLPQIMVIPESPDSIPAVELLKKDPLIKKGAEAIEQFLTARGFEVIVPEQVSELNNKLISGLSASGIIDVNYLFALSIGSDIYITYNINKSVRKIGSTTVKKYTVGCRAYETTTARLLGTEIGYSKERPASDEALIEEAMNNSIGKVLDRIVNYWKKDISSGIPYKLIITADTGFLGNEIEQYFFDVKNAIEEKGKLKVNILSDKMFDTTLWILPELFNDSFSIYQYLREKFHNKFELEKIILNRKFIYLKMSKKQ